MAIGALRPPRQGGIKVLGVFQRPTGRATHGGHTRDYPTKTGRYGQWGNSRRSDRRRLGGGSVRALALLSQHGGGLRFAPFTSSLPPWVAQSCGLGFIRRRLLTVSSNDRSPPDVPDLNASDIQHGIPTQAAAAIGQLVISWAGYETALTAWLTSAFGMAPDSAQIMIGRMDSRNKLDKLISIYKHNRLAQTVKDLNLLKSKTETFSIIRNKVAHCAYMGFKPSPSIHLFFFSNRFATGSSNEAVIDIIPLTRIRASAHFSSVTAERITQTAWPMPHE